MPSLCKFTIMFYCILYSGISYAETPTTEPISLTQCPMAVFPTIAGDQAEVTDNSITILSHSTAIEKDQLATFDGGVTLINKDHRILANTLAFNRQNASLIAEGNIHYQSNDINIFAEQLTASQSLLATNLVDTSYQLADNPGRGSAQLLSINANGDLTLKDSTFTTCVGDSPDWQLKASKINISVQDNIGEAYHARIKLFNIPVLYLPYFSFPVTNKRKSGFLYPKIKSSQKSGFELETPFYWNISENIDATITPHYMSKRGSQLQTEVRYLSGQQSGSIDIEYLHKDQAIQSNNDARYLARFQHIGTFSDNFRAYVDYTAISDDNYLVDIGSDQYNANDAYLYQIGELSYFGDQWQTSLKLHDFTVLGEHSSSYKLLPQVEFSRQQTLPFLNGQFDIYSELSRFKGANLRQNDANRYHIEAGLTFPVASPAWFLTSEFKLLQTYYQQKINSTNQQLKSHVSRTLPKIRFHGGINLERSLSLFGNNYQQTLEPQIQYLYIKDKNQEDIGIYDTAPLQDDYDGIFRDRTFSGLDRIAQANQYSWGVTSRILDDSNLERLRFSLGKISYLGSPKANQQDIISVDESAVTADLFFRLNHKWQLSGDIQYNTKNNITNKSQVSLDYQFDKNHVIQLNHRYNRNVSDYRLEQISLLGSFVLNQKWQFVGRITQDLTQKRSLETYTGLQYESCCWAIRVAYHRHINSNLDADNFINENRDEFNSGFMIQFIIKGLNAQKAATNTQDMFNSSIFGYKRPYFLNN